jgi:16S rRNA (guanine966-N2)-methyltransferase
VRVTGGRLGGRRLARPPTGVRPSADRVREALFARLEGLEGAAVLDLFAGTGALGIEAISRGAARVTFVERSRGSAAVLRRNLVSLGLGQEARLLREDVGRALRRLGREGQRFDLALLDPPYAEGEALVRALEGLVAERLLAARATVVVERGRRHPVPPVAGLAPAGERRYGDTVVTVLRAPNAVDDHRDGDPQGGSKTG